MSTVNSLSKKRAEYYKKIQIYLVRREAHRVELKKAQVKYNKSVIQLNKKIKLWNREMRRLDERRIKIKNLEKTVLMFTGINLKDTHNKMSEEIELARGFYYKYGLEHKMQAKELREVVGFKRVQQPTEYRRKITLKIASDLDTKIKWENFKKYMKKV